MKKFLLACCLVAMPATAQASPLFELVGDPLGDGGLSARISATDASAAYFNPALLTDALKQFVERKRDPSDRRRHVVRSTPEGKKMLRRLRTLAGQIEDDFLAPLDEREREALHGLLLRLAETHEPRCAPLKP